MRRFISLAMSILLIITLSGLGMAQEEEKEVRYPRIEPEEYEVEERVERPYSISFGVVEGYDNNVNLDSTRKGDGFCEQDLDFDYLHTFSDRLKLRFDYSLTNIFYHEFTDENLFDNIFGLFLESQLTDRLGFDIGYEFEILRYPNNELGDYLGHTGLVNLKYYFTDRLYMGLGYEYLDKEFDERKIRDGAGTITGTERSDERHTINHEIGYYFPNTLIKLKNRYYFNDSNDRFLDYYDYESYKVTLSLSQILTEKLFGIVGIGEEFRDYDSRTITAGGEAEEDELFIAYAAIYYDFTPALSMGLNYIYRENDSNDPIQEYSGSITSLGIYYSF